jgi:hypothetical protein
MVELLSQQRQSLVRNGSIVAVVSGDFYEVHAEMLHAGPIEGFSHCELLMSEDRN